MYVDMPRLRRLNMNIVVVPNNLLEQWQQHIVMAGVEQSWMLVAQRNHAKNLKACASVLDFAQRPEVVYNDFFASAKKAGIEQPLQPIINILMSASTWYTLLHTHQFHTVYMPLRVIKDEADGDNDMVFFADFLWLVSATTKSLIDSFTTSFGSSHKTYTLKGCIKSALYKLPTNELDEFLVSVTPERVQSENTVPPFKASVEFYTPIVRAEDIVSTLRVADFMQARNEADYTASLDLAQVLSNTVIDNFEPDENSRFLIFYYSAAVRSDRIREAVTLVKEQLPDARVENIESAGACTTMDFEAMRKTKCVVFINGLRNNAGLNLDMFTTLVIVGEVPDHICAQMIGRVQRPPRRGTF
jgi:hypothetical protein